MYPLIIHTYRYSLPEWWCFNGSKFEPTTLWWFKQKN